MSNWHGAEERLAASGMRLAAKARGTGGSDRSCSLAVLQSCGLAVLQSCSLAVSSKAAHRL